MDKFEYKVKSEEIKNLIAQRDYVQAAEIADTIDWRRVKSVMMLCTISDLYKINKRYEDARDMLLLAYDRRPGGRTICYSLCELSIKMGELSKANAYYEEFLEIAPNDSGRYILQYKLYEAQDVKLEERLLVLQKLKECDYREKWGYELAYLYHKMNLSSQCVEECDDLILWFVEGKYVIKAMELKKLYKPLTSPQQKKYDQYLDEISRQESEQAQTYSALTYENNNNYTQKATSQKTSNYTQKPFSKNIEGNIKESVNENQKSYKNSSRYENLGDYAKPPVYKNPANYAKIPVYENPANYAKPSVYESIGNNTKEPVYENARDNEKKSYDDVKIYKGKKTASEAPKVEEELDIHVKTMDVGQFNTINLQAELAGSIQEVLAQDKKISADEENKEENFNIEISESSDVETFENENMEDIEFSDIEISENSMSENFENLPEEKMEEEDWEPLPESTDIALDENEEFVQQTTKDSPLKSELEKVSKKKSAARILGVGVQEIFARKKASEETFEEISQEILEEIPEEISQEILEEIPEEISQEILEEIPEEILEESAEQILTDFNDVKEKIKISEQNSIEEENKFWNAEIPKELAAVLSQDADGQITLIMPEQEYIEKQITGQMNIEDILAEWDRIEKEKEEQAKREQAQKEQAQKERIQKERISKEQAQKEKIQKERISKEQAQKEKIQKEQIPKEQVRKRQASAKAQKFEEFETSIENKLLNQTEDDNLDNFQMAEPDMEEIESELDFLQEELFFETEEIEEEENLQELQQSQELYQNNNSQMLENVSSDNSKVQQGEQTLQRERNRIRALTKEEKELFEPFIHTRTARAQLVRVIDNISMAAYTGNIIITGEEGMDTLSLAKNIICEVKMTDRNFSGKVAKISGQSLNRRNVPATIEQLKNGALIIQKASQINTDTVKSLYKSLQQERVGIIVVLEDTKKAMNHFLERYELLKNVFTSRMDLEALSNASLVDYAKKYAKDKEYSIDELGILALHTRIAEMQTLDHVVTIPEVKQIIDEAIRSANKKTLGHFFDILFARRYDEEDMVILSEDDFVK